MKKENPLHIQFLQSGGLITNYFCSSACKHCLYASSPRRQKDYIDTATAARLFKKIKEVGCHSLHIGGGEPLLRPEELKLVLVTAQQEGMHIEYVETNSSWYKGHNSACRLLEELKETSLSRLLVSISPFHNEHIPFDKVKGVIAACQEVGMGIFPWISDFFSDIDQFPDNQPHDLTKYVEVFGNDYVRRVFRRYWIHPGGRALCAFQDYYAQKNAKTIARDTTPCIELENTAHFHFDLYENYIPGLCSGIQIHYQDIGEPLSPKKYPFLHVLYNQGIRRFYQIAVEEFGFTPKETYANKCHLCLDIRRCLVKEKELETREFGPTDFYNEF